MSKKAPQQPTMCIFHLAGSVLHCSFSFIISFTHVGQISFQNQPNAICTHVISKPKRRPCNQQTDTKTNQLSDDNNSDDNFAVTRHRPDLFSDTQANAFVSKIFPPHILKNNFSQPTLAHLVLPNTQADPSQNKKSQFPHPP